MPPTVGPNRGRATERITRLCERRAIDPDLTDTERSLCAAFARSAARHGAIAHAPDDSEPDHALRLEASTGSISELKTPWRDGTRWLAGARRHRPALQQPTFCAVMKHGLGLDVLACPCGARMKYMATVFDFRGLPARFAVARLKGCLRIGVRDDARRERDREHRRAMGARASGRRVCGRGWRTTPRTAMSPR